MSKRKIIISSIIVAVLLLGIIASSYAYFQAVISNGSTSAASVSAKTLDSLVFSECADLTITANQDNFGSGKGDLTATSTCTVKLTANNSSSASYNYKVNLSEGINNFEDSIICGATAQTLVGTGATASANIVPCDSSKWGTSGSTNGVSYKYNPDGSITLNGHPVGTAYIPVPILTDSTGRLNLSLATTYYNPTTSGYPVSAYLQVTTSTGRNVTFAPSTIWQYAQESVTAMNIVLPPSAGTLNDVTVYPMITTSSSATSYVAPGYSLKTLVISATKNGASVVNEQKIPRGLSSTGYIKSSQLASATISAEAGQTTTDTWVITVKLKNYNFDQTINVGKNFTSSVTFVKS